MEPTIKPTNSLDPYFLRERMSNRLNKRILINNTRASRATRMMNFKLSFFVIPDDPEDDDPDGGIILDPDPTPGGFDGCIGAVGIREADGFGGIITDFAPVSLIEMAVLA